MRHAHTKNYTQRVRGLGLGLGISICVKKTSFIIYVPYSYYSNRFVLLSGNDRAPPVRVVLLPSIGGQHTYQFLQSTTTACHNKKQAGVSCPMTTLGSPDLIDQLQPDPFRMRTTDSFQRLLPTPLRSPKVVLHTERPSWHDYFEKLFVSVQR